MPQEVIHCHALPRASQKLQPPLTVVPKIAIIRNKFDQLRNQEDMYPYPTARAMYLPNQGLKTTGLPSYFWAGTI